MSEGLEFHPSPNLTWVDEQGIEETVGVTAEHPFRTVAGEWVSATDLGSGVELVSEDNSKTQN